MKETTRHLMYTVAITAAVTYLAEKLVGVWYNRYVDKKIGGSLEAATDEELRNELAKRRTEEAELLKETQT